MGWSDCGTDRNGRPIGYGHEATCDHKECNLKIDRGLAFACGGMHGEGEHFCEKYFCYEHLFFVVVNDESKFLCKDCLNALESNDSYEETDEGFVRKE